MLADPEGFLEGQRQRTVVLDEIHRLENPSELLKIAADHFRDVRIVATGTHRHSWISPATGTGAAF
jgi:predicted AAA+ superfamily ATPase